MGKSKVGAHSVVNIRVGALAGPSDALMLRIAYAASPDASAGKDDVVDTQAKIFALTNDQAEGNPPIYSDCQK